MFNRKKPVLGETVTELKQSIWQIATYITTNYPDEFSGDRPRLLALQIVYDFLDKQDNLSDQIVNFKEAIMNCIKECIVLIKQQGEDVLLGKLMVDNVLSFGNSSAVQFFTPVAELGEDLDKPKKPKVIAEQARLAIHFRDNGNGYRKIQIVGLLEGKINPYDKPNYELGNFINLADRVDFENCLRIARFLLDKYPYDDNSKNIKKLVEKCINNPSDDDAFSKLAKQKLVFLGYTFEFCVTHAMEVDVLAAYNPNPERGRLVCYTACDKAASPMNYLWNSISEETGITHPLRENEAKNDNYGYGYQWYFTAANMPRVVEQKIVQFVGNIDLHDLEQHMLEEKAIFSLYN